ncbi:hypothetical protein K438DRAFT_1979556 [Mycena galopus ATCC 62051]|nr:hypothetical protein K438DRAFT_1979556 [Mycena galopus ATCC 62051]
MTTIRTGFSFPPELEREIFETTAMRYPDFIPTLLLVCRQVHMWIEPLLYRVITISNLTENPSRLLSAVEAKPTDFLKRSVRHVSIYDPSGPYENLLAKCSGTINLVLDDDLDLNVLPFVANMCLQRLSLSVGSPFSHSDLPFFASVTHLDFFHGSIHGGPLQWENWAGLVSLPVLTHLALSPTIATDILAQVMEGCPRLVMAVVPAYAWDRAAAISFARDLTLTDPRVVVMVVGTDPEVDWKLGAWGGDDFWIRAAAFLEQKRLGTIEKNCYLLDETAGTTPPRTAP